MADEDFITKVLTVPLTKRAQLPVNQRKIQTVGKGFTSLINDMTTNKLDKQLTGYVSFLDEQTNSLVLKITTLKKYDKLLSDFLRRATKSRSAGGAGFNEYGRKNSTIEDVDTEYSTFDLSPMSEKKKASLKYSLLSKTGIMPGDNDVTLPSNTPITRKVKNEIRRGSVNTSALKNEYDYVTWKEALERDRKSRAIFEGKKESDLKYQLPENNKYGITQEFVDQQNKQLEQEKLKEAGVGTTKGFLFLLLAGVSSILNVTKKILNYSKQGAEAAQARTASAQEFALSKAELDAIRIRETDLGTAGKGTILNIFKELTSNYNAATSLNDKELEKLALLGNASGRDTLIQKGLDIALSGGGVLELFNAIEEAVDEVVSQGIDVVSGKYIGSDEAKRQTANFLGGAWLPYLTQSWAVAQSESAGNRTGTSVEVTDLTQQVAQAHDVSKSNLEKLLEDLSINLAAWMHQFGILDRIYDILLRMFGSIVDKETQRQFAFDQNTNNSAALQATAAALESSSTVQDVQERLKSTTLQKALNTKLGNVTLPGGRAYSPTIRELLDPKGNTNAISAFNALSVNQWKTLANTLSASEEGKELLSLLPTYFLLQKSAAYMKANSGFTGREKNVTVPTSEMALQQIQADIARNNGGAAGGFTLGNLDEAIASGVFGNIQVAGRDTAQKQASVIDMFTTGVSTLSGLSVAPDKATVVNLENNITITNPDGTTKTYTVAGTLETSKNNLENYTNINGMTGSTYGRGSTPIKQN